MGGQSQLWLDDILRPRREPSESDRVKDHGWTAGVTNLGEPFARSSSNAIEGSPAVLTSDVIARIPSHKAIGRADCHHRQ
jgi:hypothetical protein